MSDKVYKQTIIVHISFIYLQDGFLVSNNTAYMVEPAGKLANIFQNSSHYLRKRSAGIIASKFYYIFDMGAVVVLIVWQFDLQLHVESVHLIAIPFQRDVPINIRFHCFRITYRTQDRRGRDRMVVAFTSTYAISAYHH